jgi:GTP-binding protein
MKFSVVIAGKPNVGKSSLFNKLSSRRLAIVNDKPGVTRDTKEYQLNLDDREIILIDTAGWEDKQGVIEQQMLKQTADAVSKANLVLFVVDARNGITPDDLEFASVVRKSGREVVLIANKSESRIGIDTNQLYGLGFGEPIYCSSAHGNGISELIDTVISRYDAASKEEEKQEGFNPRESLKIAIIGRPNVGKSTLFNSILGFERSITSPLMGTTRDSINYFFHFNERLIELIDTAGLRKKANINEKIEELSAVESINAIRRSNISLLVISAEQPLEKQDLAIARVAIQEGKPVVLVVNKYDLIKNKKYFQDEVDFLVGENLSELSGLPIVYISALNKQGVDDVFAKVLEIEAAWCKKIATSKLNQWLEEATSSYIPPLAKNGRRIRIKYVTQSKTKPPTFNFNCNIPEDLPGSYIKYLRNSLRNCFDLLGIPIRMNMLKNKNPYQSKS